MIKDLQTENSENNELNLDLNFAFKVFTSGFWMKIVLAKTMFKCFILIISGNLSPFNDFEILLNRKYMYII